MYLLDTNICIYIIKKKPVEVLRKLQSKAFEDICISSIAVAELEYGAAKSAYPERNKTALMKFLTLFSILPFDDRDAVAYGLVRADLEKKGKPIGPYDLLIAAQALSKNLVLVTNNVNEFERVEGVVVENWV